MMRFHTYIVVFLLTLCGGCGGWGGWNQDLSSGPTLADLEPIELASVETPVPRLALEELAAIYRDVLGYQDDPQTRLEILHRLADIEMLVGEEGMAEGVNKQALLGPAIAAYEKLLRENPDYPARDTIAYQLSKAYDLRGDTQRSMQTLSALKQANPDSPYIAEASFRLAERHFANANYASSEALYAQVVDFGSDTPFYTRGLYMQGWSRFKQDRFADAIEPFTKSLDHHLRGDIEGVDLPRAQRELVEDSLRVLALSFSNLGGTDSIAQAYQPIGVRPYQHRLYEALGALYLQQERYRDSAGVYQAYLEAFPASPLAHSFRLQTIAAYEAGGFPELILQAKQGYVEQFAVSSQYWQSSDGAVRETIQPVLRQYLEELASHFHSLAQSVSKRASGVVGIPENAKLHYAKAAGYYREFIASFPQDPVVPKKAFLLAESLYEATEYSLAQAAYDEMAYSYSDDPQAADAAYMGILSYQKLPSASADEETTAKLRFARTFVEDERAVAVLGDAASQLLDNSEYASAIAAANELVSRNPPTELGLSAYLVVGHSQFALEAFEQAEQAYSRALPLLASTDTRRQDTQERIAASLYRQAENSRTDDETLAAAALFERAIAAAPDSEIATTALYDAATAYYNAGDLERANKRFKSFRQRYPNHALSKGITALLVSNYEQLEDWQGAATQLDRLAVSAADSEQRRQSQLLAAQYYDKAAVPIAAIERYSSYAKQWPSPLEPRIEAIHRLTQLHDEQLQSTGPSNTEKVSVWLRLLEAVHAEAGDQQSERSAYLAANACTRLAQPLFSTFESVKLVQPIKRSLKRKRQVMQRSLDAYSRCSGYGVEEFTTLSNLRIGLTYQSFSKALMDSQRPDSLDALALEQYDMMLEEQAYPFEEKAIDIFESNVMRCQREGVYDDSVRASYAALASLEPARYRKQEALTLSIDDPAGKARNRGKKSKLQKLNKTAIAMREAGDFDGAKKNYTKALSLAEDDALTHRNLGILLELYMGEPTSALAHYQRYQALTGGSDRAVAGWIALLERRTVSVAGDV